MTIIADRGLFVRILTASGKVGAAEAGAYADALDGASKDPATKADIAGLRAEVALLAQRVEAQGVRLNERADVSEKRLIERADAMEKRLEARIEAAVERQFNRFVAVLIAALGLHFAALRYTGH